MAFTTMHTLELSRSSTDDTFNLLLRLFELSGNECTQDISFDLDFVELRR